MMKKLLFYSCIVLLSCNAGRPTEVIPPEKMQQVLWDYIRADIYASEFISKDSSKNPVEENAKMQAALFSKYNISKEQFYRSYEYYISHNKEMKAMLDTITTRQQRIEQQKYKDQNKAASNTTDSLGKKKDSLAAARPDSSKKVFNNFNAVRDSLRRNKSEKRKIKIFNGQ